MRFVSVLLLSGSLLALPEAHAIANRDAAASPATLYEDAMTRAAEGDYTGAVIQLKNLLQQVPKDLPARIALGRFQLRTGESAAAEKELRSALRLGADPRQVLPVLGNALLAQRKYAEILDVATSPDPGINSTYELTLLRARAHFELNSFDKADAEFSKARKLGQDKPEPVTGLALVALAQNRMQDAADLIDAAIRLSPEDPETWYQKGEIARAAKQPNEALKAFDRTLKLNPSHMRALLSRTGLRLELGDFEGARADAEIVRERNPRDITAAFLAGQAHLALGNDVNAKEAFEVASQRLASIKEDALMKEASLLRMAAFISFSKRDLTRTERYLNRFAELNPLDMGMQILLGRVQLQQGDAKAAISTLFPLYKRDPTNLAIVAPLGQAYFKIGHYAEAADMFQRAQALAPGDEQLKAQAALSKIGLGEWDSALSDLKAAANEEDKQSSAGLLLTILQLKGGDVDGALATIDAQLARQQSARAMNLRGIVLAMQGDLEAARAAFEASAKADPALVPPAFNLAKLDMADGKLDAAEQRFKTIIARDAQSVSALLGLADVALLKQDTRGAIDSLKKAISISPGATDAQERLVDLQLAAGDTAAALEAARDLSAKLPENPSALILLARAQAAAGNEDRAIRSYREATRYAGFNLQQLIQIARQLVGIGALDEARKTLLKASQAGGDTSAVQAALVRLDIQTERLDTARARAEELGSIPASDALGYVLLGEVELAERRPQQAVEAYEQSLKLAAGTEAQLGLFNALNAAGQRDQALQRLEGWVSDHPEDREAKRTLALGYVPNGRLADARKLLETLIVAEPNDPVLLSTLARIYQLDKDKRARPYAERAVLSRPDWAPALDTLGWILVTEGDVAQGLEYLRQAISRADNPLTRYHLAQALNEAGRITEARAELRTLLAVHPNLAWKADVERLDAELAAAEQAN